MISGDWTFGNKYRQQNSNDQIELGEKNKRVMKSSPFSPFYCFSYSSYTYIQWNSISFEIYEVRFSIRTLESNSKIASFITLSYYYLQTQFNYHQNLHNATIIIAFRFESWTCGELVDRPSYNVQFHTAITYRSLLLKRFNSD